MPIILKDPFPTQDSKMIGSSLNSLEEPILMMFHVGIAVRSQDYGSKNHVGGKEA